MKEFELIISGHWYARVDGNHIIRFDSKDLLDSGLEPEQYAAQLFAQAKFPNVTWHDFDQDIVHEKEQILGDLVIDPVWTLREYLKHDDSNSGND